MSYVNYETITWNTKATISNKRNVRVVLTAEIGGGTEMGYNQFFQRQPTQSDGTNILQCVYADPRYGYQWYTSDCSAQRNFICQYSEYG